MEDYQKQELNSWSWLWYKLFDRVLIIKSKVI